jgi:hypothetical protein
MTLGELIAEKGLKQNFLVEKLNEKEVEISEAHFSRLCNDAHTPRGNRFYSALSDLLSESEDKIRSCFKNK